MGRPARTFYVVAGGVIIAVRALSASEPVYTARTITPLAVDGRGYGLGGVFSRVEGGLETFTRVSLRRERIGDNRRHTEELVRDAIELATFDAYACRA